MMDREWLLAREHRRDEEMRQFQEREAESDRRHRFIIFALVIAMVAFVLITAFIGRSGRPTIIINQPSPIIQPSTSGTEGSQPYGIPKQEGIVPLN